MNMHLLSPFTADSFIRRSKEILQRFGHLFYQTIVQLGICFIKMHTVLHAFSFDNLKERHRWLNITEQFSSSGKFLSRVNVSVGIFQKQILFFHKSRATCFCFGSITSYTDSSHMESPLLSSSEGLNLAISWSLTRLEILDATCKVLFFRPSGVRFLDQFPASDHNFGKQLCERFVGHILKHFCHADAASLPSWQNSILCFR